MSDKRLPDGRDADEQLYEFECPECGFDHKEAGQLAGENHRYCGVCAGDCGRDVLLKRWLPGKKPVDPLIALRTENAALRRKLQIAEQGIRDALLQSHRVSTDKYMVEELLECILQRMSEVK